MVKFKDFSRPLSVFQVLFKANLIFKDFQDSPVYSSTFQACAKVQRYFKKMKKTSVLLANTNIKTIHNLKITGLNFVKKIYFF